MQNVQSQVDLFMEKLGVIEVDHNYDTFYHKFHINWALWKLSHVTLLMGYKITGPCDNWPTWQLGYEITGPCDNRPVINELPSYLIAQLLDKIK